MPTHEPPKLEKKEYIMHYPGKGLGTKRVTEKLIGFNRKSNPRASKLKEQSAIHYHRKKTWNKNNSPKTQRFQ